MKISELQSTCPLQLIWQICQILNFEKTLLALLRLKPTNHTEAVINYPFRKFCLALSVLLTAYDRNFGI